MIPSLVCKGYGIKMIRMKGDTLMIKLDGEVLYHRDKIKKYRVKLLSLKWEHKVVNNMRFQTLVFGKYE